MGFARPTQEEQRHDDLLLRKKGRAHTSFEGVSSTRREPIIAQRGIDVSFEKEI